MLTTLIAAALVAAAPAPAGQVADPHAGHGKHGMAGAMHGEMCKDCKSGEGAAKHQGCCCCCKDVAGADKAKCCAEHGEHKK